MTASVVRWGIVADLLGGEPPTACHPTVWMGHLLGAARAWHGGRARGPAASLLAGGAVVGASVLAAIVAAWAAERALERLPRRVQAAAAGTLLKPALSLRALLAAGREVEDALRRGDLCEARRLLAWHLVSRDTTGLTASEVAGAAIESLAENLSDGLVAPLVWHAAAGLPGAYAYRMVNTADAMLGYRTPELEWFGKPAARADDLLNLVPARLTAVLVVAAAAAVPGASAAGALRAARHDAGRTTSPNAGWPMAAMAGALGVRLDKRVDRPRGEPRPAPRRARRVYLLHPTGRAPAVADLARARHVVAAAAALALALAHAPRRMRGAA